MKPAVLAVMLSLCLPAAAQKDKARANVAIPDPVPTSSNAIEAQPEPQSFVGYRPGQSKEEALALARSRGMKPLSPSRDNPRGMTCIIQAPGIEQCGGYGGGGGAYCVATTLSFVDGQLATMFCELPQIAYKDVVEAIIAKYGQPTESSRREVKTKIGATFESADFKWSNGTGSITANEYFESLDQSAIRLEGDELAKQMRARVKKPLPQI